MTLEENDPIVHPRLYCSTCKCWLEAGEFSMDHRKQTEHRMHRQYRCKWCNAQRDRGAEWSRHKAAMALRAFRRDSALWFELRGEGVVPSGDGVFDGVDPVAVELADTESK